MPTATTARRTAAATLARTATIDAFAGVIARTCALARADWLAQFAPLAGLAAVGQRIHDIDADRAEQLARRNASNERVQRWAVESAESARAAS